MSAATSLVSCTTELRDVDEAKAKALVQARDIIGHEATKGQIDLAQRIEVRDRTGCVVCSVNFADAVSIRR